MISPLFDPEVWIEVEGLCFQDITYHHHRHHGLVRVAFNRREVRNAFRPQKPVDELFLALDHARMSPKASVVLLTGNGPSPKDAVWSFCSGGDQRMRGPDGHQYVDEQGRLGPVRLGRCGTMHPVAIS